MLFTELVHAIHPDLMKDVDVPEFMRNLIQMMCDIPEILALYAREKQKKIFIAFDREGKYDIEPQSIIQENTVLKLDTDEQALFGWKWSRKDVEK